MNATVHTAFSLRSRLIRTLIFACFLAAVASTRAQVPSTAVEAYQIRPAEDSRFSLEVAKTGLLSGKTHRFVFPDYNGTVLFNQQAPLASQVEVHIQTKTIECLDEWISEKDKVKVLKEAREAMLAVNQFPELLFRSTRLEQTATNQFRVLGDLIIRGITKPAAVHVTLIGNTDDGLHVTGDSVVKLTDYNLKPPKTLLGAIGTKDAMKISFNLRASRK